MSGICEKDVKLLPVTEMGTINNNLTKRNSVLEYLYLSKIRVSKA